MEKKKYVAPKLTDHGSVVRETKGFAGDSYEPMGRDVWEDNKFGVMTGFIKPVQDK